MQVDRTKDHPDPTAPLAEIEREIATGRALASKSGKLRRPLTALADALAAVVAVQQQSIGRYATLARQSARVTDRVVAERTAARARDLTPSAATVTERAALESDERAKASAGLRSQVGEELADKAQEAAQDAHDKARVAAEALAAAEAEQQVVPVLRVGSAPQQAVMYFQLSELRQSGSGMLPSEIKRGWEGLLASKASDDAKEKYAYVMTPILRERIAGGTIKLRQSLPTMNEGAATRELGAAWDAVRAFERWQSEREPEWIKAGRASLEILTRAFKSACGLDVRHMSRAEFARLYLGGTMMHDPGREPFKLAKPEQIATRFLPAKLAGPR